MARFVVCDEGDYPLAYLSAKTAEEVAQQVSDQEHIPYDELHVWTETAYRKAVLSHPWWELERDDIPF